MIKKNQNDKTKITKNQIPIKTKVTKKISKHKKNPKK